MELISKLLETYCANHSDDEPEILKIISRNTYARVLSPRMLSGHFQGRLLSMISHLVSPKNILEIGTYTAYSAICLAEGLAVDGQLITLEANEEYESLIREHIALAGLDQKIKVIIGPAAESIKNLKEEFDIVFIDADKLSYKLYYDEIFQLVKNNGLIICDNVLWDGKVINQEKNDKTTQYLREFNIKMKEDKRTQKILLPVRDGLFISRKIL